MHLFKKGFLCFKWLNKREEIFCLRRSGSLHRGKYVNIWVLPRKDTDGSKLTGISVIIGKGFENSVARNLAKRRVTGCIIENRGLLNKNCSYLIECRPGSERKKYQILVKDIKELLINIS